MSNTTVCYALDDRPNIAILHLQRPCDEQSKDTSKDTYWTYMALPAPLYTQASALFDYGYWFSLILSMGI